jgi:hypothetical protein
MILLIAFGIQVVVLRWIFMIDRQVNNQSKMINLLAVLCKQQGVNPVEVDSIIAQKKQNNSTKHLSDLLTKRSSNAE